MLHSVMNIIGMLAGDIAPIVIIVIIVIMALTVRVEIDVDRLHITEPHAALRLAQALMTTTTTTIIIKKRKRNK